jgi:hypothetical protein
MKIFNVFSSEYKRGKVEQLLPVAAYQTNLYSKPVRHSLKVLKQALICNLNLEDSFLVVEDENVEFLAVSDEGCVLPINVACQSDWGVEGIPNFIITQANHIKGHLSSGDKKSIKSNIGFLVDYALLTSPGSNYVEFIKSQLLLAFDKYSQIIQSQDRKTFEIKMRISLNKCDTETIEKYYQRNRIALLFNAFLLSLYDPEFVGIQESVKILKYQVTNNVITRSTIQCLILEFAKQIQTGYQPGDMDYVVQQANSNPSFRKIIVLFNEDLSFVVDAFGNWVSDL